MLVEIGTVETVMRQLFAKALKKERKFLKSISIYSICCRVFRPVVELGFLAGFQPHTVSQACVLKAFQSLFFTCFSTTTLASHLFLHFMSSAQPGGCKDFHFSFNLTTLGHGSHVHG